ncbi:MAG: 2-C-methyl-D-erythritol 4-phosphate cytidylyltransferase [Gammaproteobacteria bacterium]
MTAAVRFWAVIPAAGTGSRMLADTPKQYLSINGRHIIEYSLVAFCGHPDIAGVVVAIAAGDKLWPELPSARNPKITTTAGGAVRCQSVLNGLQTLATMADTEDWVLVHDAARPCIRTEDIGHLITTLRDHPVGGVLALPVRDTMKRADIEQGDGQHVSETINRQGLWHALTPQMFRLGRLTRALEEAIAQGQLVTDESQAMELAGYRPKLVEGRVENIKITRPSDLRLAELYLS